MLWSSSQRSYFDLFEAHCQEILAAAQLLNQLLGGTSTPIQLAALIKEREHIADNITHAVLKQVHVTFISPMDRDDIMAYIKALDNVLDGINNVATAFAEVYGLSQGTLFADEFAKQILRGTDRLIEANAMLRHPSNNRDAILAECVAIHKIENEGDETRKEALKDLYSRMKSGALDMPSYLAWSELYRALEEITDCIEECAHIAEQIVMKYS